MKTLFFVIQIWTLTLFGQSPSIGNFTVIPASPIAGQSISIVSRVTTPSQGVLVDKTFNVSTNPNLIQLHLCYGFGMLPATHTYVDTFSIGTLPAGSFSIILKAFMSSANQHCNKIDSNIASHAIQVNVTNGIERLGGIKEVEIFPNPAVESLNFRCDCNQLKASIINVNGQVIKQAWLQPNESLPFKDLPLGLYFLRVEVDGFSRVFKVLRTEE